MYIYVIAIIVGVSILLFSIGKTAGVSRLWLYGVLFAAVVVSEIVVFLCVDVLAYWLGVRVSIAYLVGSIGLSVLICMGAKAAEFEERFIIFFASPFVILYVLNPYVGITIGLFLAITINASISENIFREHNFRGVLSSALSGFLIALSLITLSLSALALSTLCVFLYFYNIKILKQNVVEKEIDRMGVYFVDEHSENIIRIIGLLETELDSKVDLLMVDGEIFLCSDFYIWKLDAKSRFTHDLLKNLHLEEIKK